MRPTHTPLSTVSVCCWLGVVESWSMPGASKTVMFAAFTIWPTKLFGMSAGTSINTMCDGVELSDDAALTSELG